METFGHPTVDTKLKQNMKAIKREIHDFCIILRKGITISE